MCEGFRTRSSRLRLIELRRNFGTTAALQAGLNEAATGDIIVSMDSDLQHFPEDLPVLLAKLEEGYDLVCGWRHQRKENTLRRWPSRMANAVIRRITGTPIHDFGTTYRAYRADLVRHMKLLGEQHRFVPALAHMVGARVAEVPIQNIVRPAGASNYGIGRTLGVALDILYLYFIKRYLDRPLRAFGKLAFAFFAVGGVIFTTLVGDRVYDRHRHSAHPQWLVPALAAVDACRPATAARWNPCRNNRAHLLRYPWQRRLCHQSRMDRRVRGCLASNQNRNR